MDEKRLRQQIQFIIEIDRLKEILRQNVVINSRRRENDAEHSWHLALMAVIFAEYAAEENLDMLKVLKMLLIHDLVEIDAGDTFCYDERAQTDKKIREQKAAVRLFNILPSDQAREIYDLWQEFDELATPESIFAASLDRLQPLILNYHTKGHTWQDPGVTKEKVLKRNKILASSAPLLWDLVQEIIEDSVEKGYLRL